ncbi:hypothetical protein JTP68_03135 [Dietzia cinnamea]|uniref:hypothetical protein n=1 Tax=Dietzia cinnamea TaxID=321318 RepID=UPI000D6228B9|nr:hypothetical protein [Dietzia cinnamea]PWD96141.1 hypothetical protein DEQ16_06885 [Dietzia maris]
MATPDGPDLAARARDLLDDARVAEAAIDTAAATLFRLGGDVARAGTRREAARSGARVAAERDRVSGLLGELAVLSAAADRLGAELVGSASGDAVAGGAPRGGAPRGEVSGGGVPRGEVLDGGAPRGPARDGEARRGEVRAVLESARRVLEAAGERGRECVWIGELARDRVHDFAEFDLLYTRASRHLDHSDPDAAAADLARLVTLERALVSAEVAAMLDELRFRLLTERD